MVKVPYAVGVPLDNLVLEVEDLNVEENPQSLSIALYRGPEADGKCTGRSGSCTQEQLQELTPLRTVSDARARIFSFGLSSIEMQARARGSIRVKVRARGWVGWVELILALAHNPHPNTNPNPNPKPDPNPNPLPHPNPNPCPNPKQEYICGGKCTSSGVFRLNLVVRCTSSHVRFQAISILTPLILDRGVPVHGEVCPGNWIYHKTFIPDNDKYHDASGVRFNVHVHQGDIYYMITRWDHSPGFAACNENEVAMSFQRDGHAELCHLTEKFECTFSEADKAAAAANGTELSLIGYIGLNGGTLALALALSLSLALALALTLTRYIGLYGGTLTLTLSLALALTLTLTRYIGLYGGTSCAHYTIETERLVNTTCSIATTGTCGEVKACA